MTPLSAATEILQFYEYKAYFFIGKSSNFQVQQSQDIPVGHFISIINLNFELTHSVIQTDSVRNARKPLRPQWSGFSVSIKRRPAELPSPPQTPTTMGAAGAFLIFPEKGVYFRFCFGKKSPKNQFKGVFLVPVSLRKQKIGLYFPMFSLFLGPVSYPRKYFFKKNSLVGPACGAGSAPGESEGPSGCW